MTFPVFIFVIYTAKEQWFILIFTENYSNKDVKETFEMCSICELNVEYTTGFHIPFGKSWFA